MMVVKKEKSVFEKLETFVKTPPILNLQIWDNDTFTPDDFLGATSINLSHFKSPFITSEECSVNDNEADFVNIFSLANESVRGWFPVRGQQNKNAEIKQTVS